MKAVILAGGLGTRLSEETVRVPKPLVEIGGWPIIWHIMKIYSHYGINDFVVCLGFKGYAIKEYFANFFLHRSNVTVDLSSGECQFHETNSEKWRVSLIDTGQDTMTGGRLKRVRPFLGAETFCLTYGDGVSNVDIAKLIAFHRSHRKLATVTAIQQSGRFGALDLGGNVVKEIREKPPGDSWINGGFFVLEPSVLDYIEDDSTIWERAPLEGLARDGQLQAFRHEGFWHPMDTLRDRTQLEEMWAQGRAPWKIWS